MKNKYKKTNILLIYFGKLKMGNNWLKRDRRDMGLRLFQSLSLSWISPTYKFNKNLSITLQLVFELSQYL